MLAPPVPTYYLQRGAVDPVGGPGDHAAMTREAEQRIVDGRAWADFCRALERAGDAVLRRSTPANAFDRAEGWRYLTRLLRAALESQVEHGDPRFPGLYQLSN